MRGKQPGTKEGVPRLLARSAGVLAGLRLYILFLGKTFDIYTICIFNDLCAA